MPTINQLEKGRSTVKKGISSALDKSPQKECMYQSLYHHT